MRPRTAWLLAAALTLCAGPVLAANFAFECKTDRYASKPLGEQHVFQAPLMAVAPGDDSVDVIFEPHVPDSWFSQYCQVSTGICYFASQRIRLQVGQIDRLDIDFFPDGDSPKFGWVDVTIRSVADPNEVARCTYTLWSGLPEPAAPKLEIDCLDNTRQLTAGTDYTEFWMPVRNASTTVDTLVCQMLPSVPEDWFGQFCIQSTGICYFDRAEVPLPPGFQDSVHVQIFVGAAPSSGALDFVLQSKRNPSDTNYCNYRVYTGTGAAGAPQAVAAGPRVWVVPNPSAGAASIVLRSADSNDGRFTIFGADGRLVRDFPVVDLRTGSAELRWDGRDAAHAAAPSGIYFYRFVAGDREARGMIVRAR